MRRSRSSQEDLSSSKVRDHYLVIVLGTRSFISFGAFQHALKRVFDRSRPTDCPQDKEEAQFDCYQQRNLKMSVVEEKSLKVIAFSGKQDDWKFWEVKFLARARRKGFREILLGKETIPKDDEKFDLTDPKEKAQSEMRDKNELAFEELVLSIDTSTGDGRVAFQAICCCKNDDYKNGNAADAWK